jgi:hypothetical protein
MKIKNVELSLLKASQVEDGDVILVRISKAFKEKMTAEKARDLYNQIKSMVAEDKNIGIFFFPKEMELSLIKGYLEQAEKLIQPPSEDDSESTEKKSEIRVNSIDTDSGVTENQP